MRKFQCPYCGEKFDSVIECDDHTTNECEERPSHMRV